MHARMLADNQVFRQAVIMRFGNEQLCLQHHAVNTANPSNPHCTMHARFATTHEILTSLLSAM